MAELPANVIAKRVGARKYLGFLALFWGVALSQGFVRTHGQLYAVRVILGLFERGLNPICAFIVTSWYRKFEVQQRLSIWFITGVTVAGFNGLLSYGISHMDGAGGYRGWRWIMILPGAATIVLAVVAFLWLPDFPEKARFLTPEEKDFVIQRLACDQGEETEDRVTMKAFIAAVSDWKVHVVSIFLVFPSSSAYAMAYFTPTILSSIGFSEALSLLLTTPPYFPVIIGCCVGVIVENIMMGWGNNVACKLVGVFLAIGTNYCIVPASAAFLANNVAGHGKRGVAVSMQWIWSAIGEIIGSNIFREKDAPTYRPGLFIGIAFKITLILLTLGITTYYWHKNRESDKRGEGVEGVDGFRIKNTVWYKLLRRCIEASPRTCQPAQLQPIRPTWEQWIFEETRRRVLVTCWLVAIVINPGGANPVNRPHNIPLPGSRSLWEARSRVEWERAYSAEQAGRGEGDVSTIGELTAALHGGKGASTGLSGASYHLSQSAGLDRWQAGLDSLGTMLTAVLAA